MCFGVNSSWSVGTGQWPGPSTPHPSATTRIDVRVRPPAARGGGTTAENQQQLSEGEKAEPDHRQGGQIHPHRHGGPPVLPSAGPIWDRASFFFPILFEALEHLPHLNWKQDFSSSKNILPHRGFHYFWVISTQNLVFISCILAVFILQSPIREGKKNIDRKTCSNIKFRELAKKNPYSYQCLCDYIYI